MDWTRNMSVPTAKKTTVDCPWNPWIIRGFRESAWTPQGLPGGVVSPPLLRAIILDAEAPQAQGLGDELLIYVAKYVPEALSTVPRNVLDLLMMVLKTCSIHFERLVLYFHVV